MKNIYLSRKWNNLLQHVCRTTHRAHRAVVAILVLCFSFFLLTGCRVSYKLNGASIDYSKTKTIEIAEFPIRSSYVWGPMGPMFNNKLKDMFADHTRLQQVKRNGDLVLSGEITQYSQRNKSVSKEDFEKQFTASQSYATTQSLNSVQEQLVSQMCDDLINQIFNAALANW